MQEETDAVPSLSQIAGKLGMGVDDLRDLLVEIEAAKTRLWDAHQNMVFKLARQYMELGGVPLGDLIAVRALST
jgi:hypothetical protein